MTGPPAATAPGAGARGFRAYWALGGLVLGILLGAVAGGLSAPLHEGAVRAAAMVGGLWLNALKMTVIPLVVALLVVGIVQSAEAARAGRIAGRAVAWIVAICTASAVFGTLVMLLLTRLFPLSADAAQALRGALAGVDATAATGPLPSLSDFFTGIIPANVVAAASNGDVLPLVVFSLLFALAISRIAPGPRDTLVRLFQAIADALLLMIAWVLAVAPLGVFALGFTVGATAGGAAFGAVLHYILLISLVGVLVTLAGYPLGIIAGRIPAPSFVRALLGPQAVAISTRSSLASLPAMLASAREMRIRNEVADVTLPLAVALFRGTGPAMNVAVAIYIAHWFGIHPGFSQLIAATAVAAVISYGAVSLPGEITYISSIAPICMALGVPVAPLALFVAVEMIPDIFRTLGNVTLDVAVTAAVGRGAESASES